MGFALWLNVIFHRLVGRLLGTRRLLIAIALAAILLGVVIVVRANANDRGVYQEWDERYTARELLADCAGGVFMERCLFFVQTIGQAKFWFDKCIPTNTDLSEIIDVTRAFVRDTPYAADAAATNVVLTALSLKWKCK
jgi:hypothetical protein